MFEQKETPGVNKVMYEVESIESDSSRRKTEKNRDEVKLYSSTCPQDEEDDDGHLLFFIYCLFLSGY